MSQESAERADRLVTDQTDPEGTRGTWFLISSRSAEAVRQAIWLNTWAMLLKRKNKGG